MVSPSNSLERKKRKFRQILARTPLIHFWLYYPVLVLVLGSAGLYLGAMNILQEKYSDPVSERAGGALDLAAPEASNLLLKEYIKARGGELKLNKIFRAETITYGGLLEADGRRYLFSATVQPMRSVTIDFISEGKQFVFDVAPRLQPREPDGLKDAKKGRLSMLAGALAELSAYCVNPLYAVGIHADRFQIAGLERTDYVGRPALAVDITCEHNPSHGAIVYLDETVMRGFAVESRLASEQTLTYFLSQNDRDAGEPFPEQIRVERADGDDWTVYLSNVQTI